MAGAGGSLRAGVTENPVLLTRSVAKGETRVTMGGAPVYVWPGGGITVMVDVTRMPKNAFGYVPTPAIVAPIEFTLPRALYERLGGHVADIVSVGDVIREVAAERPHRRAGATTTPGRSPRTSKSVTSSTRLRESNAMTNCQSSAQAGRARGPRARGLRSTCSRTRSASCCAARTSARPRSSTP